MTSKARHRELAAGLLVVCWLLTACGGAPERTGLATVDHPDLATVEATARQQLEAQRQQLDEALGKGDDRVLADAFGSLGEHYHTYELLEPAAACYANAERLDPESFLWPYFQGLLEQTRGDLTRAAQHLQRALELRPDNPSARIRLATAELGLGQLAAAEGNFAAVAEQADHAAAAHYGLGRVAAQRGDHQAAAEHFETALDRDSKATAARHPLALAYRHLGRTAEAEALLAEPSGGEVTFPDPLMTRLEALARSSGALMRRGNRALMAGQTEQAIEAFRAAIRANPDYSETRRNLGLALLRAGRAEEAVSELREAVERHPDNAWLHFDLGNAHLQSGQPVLAAEAFARAAENAPEMLQAHFSQANALAALERWPEALVALERALELDPAEPRARYLAAMARHKTGDSGAAVQQLEALVAEDPADRVARDGLVTVLSETGRGRRAYDILRQAPNADASLAERGQRLDTLAKLAWQIGRRDEALAHYRAAVDLQPESSFAHTQLANALQLAGQNRQAIELFAKAVELDPANATAWLSEASLWILEGEQAIARDRLLAAIDEHPDNPQLLHTLARLQATASDPDVRDGAAALPRAQRAFALQNSIDHAETVAMAMAADGQFEAAIKWQRSLAMNAVRAGDQAAARKLSVNLRLYEKREAIVMTP